MKTHHEAWRNKVTEIFMEHFGERGKHLPMQLDKIQGAIQSESDEKRAHDIAFHLTDWNGEAAFLVALSLFPERFTEEDIQQGVTACLIHIPNHIAAAATLGGWPMSDIFKVGATIES